MWCCMSLTHSSSTHDVPYITHACAHNTRMRPSPPCVSTRRSRTPSRSGSHSGHHHDHHHQQQQQQLRSPSHVRTPRKHSGEGGPAMVHVEPPGSSPAPQAWPQAGAIVPEPVLPVGGAHPVQLPRIPATTALTELATPSSTAPEAPWSAPASAQGTPASLHAGADAVSAV